ncbi:MAG: hypothetical protein QXT64_04785 [Desulfurococcaceae archaeon]
MKTVRFVERVVDGRVESYPYVSVEPFPSKEELEVLVREGAVRKVYVTDARETVWVFDEKKATEVFRRMGYEVVPLIESKKRYEMEILAERAAWPETYVSGLDFWPEARGGVLERYLTDENLLAEGEKEVELKGEYGVTLKSKAKVKLVEAKEYSRIFEEKPVVRKGFYVVVEVAGKRFFAPVGGRR